MDPTDFYRKQLSNCCGARILLGDICSDCREHCDADLSEDEEEPTELEDRLDQAFRQSRLP